MNLGEFKIERFFAAHEFKVRYLLSVSDCESFALGELLALADAGSLGLWHDLRLGYTESQGHPLLREEIARFYDDLDRDDILIATPEELIFIAMNVLLAPGDGVIVTSPAYQSLYEVAAALGCTVTQWMLEPTGDERTSPPAPPLLGEGSNVPPSQVGKGPGVAPAWRIDLTALERSITPRTRLLVINFPHNPTGYLPSRGELAAILAIAQRHGLYVFSDEMYRLLELDPERRLPPACDLYDHAIVLSGLSKAYGLPGLRIGWLAARDRAFLSRCMTFKDYTTICSSAPSEILGIIALRNRVPITERNLAIVRGNLEAAGRFFERNAGLFAWLPPQAGSIAFPALSSHLPVADFCRGLLDAETRYCCRETYSITPATISVSVWAGPVWPRA